MCDTFVALTHATLDGGVVFGKNSDRDPNEAHQLVSFPSARYPAGSMLKCTYISIPQVEETYAVLLAKPFWIWGAEMGANEYGVVIGNEAVFSKVPAQKQPGMIGMDFLRLALERAADARSAVDVITGLLEIYGQSGNCGFEHPSYYHNSFLIADPREAWVLETVAKHWAAVKVQDVRSISNAITIGSEWDLASKDLVGYAVERGWCKSAKEFHFGRCYSDFINTRFSDAAKRQCRTTDLLRENIGRITPALAMSILRDHGHGATAGWTPADGLTGANVCAHASFGPVRGWQSTGSLVSHLAQEGTTHWATATSAPCTSTFKPVWLEAGLPDLGPQPSGRYDPSTLWWRHEDLHRETLRDYATRLSQYQRDRDALEAGFLEQAQAVRCSSVEEKQAFSRSCFEQVNAAEKTWLERIRALPVEKHPHWLYRHAWKVNDEHAWRR